MIAFTWLRRVARPIVAGAVLASGTGCAGDDGLRRALVELAAVQQRIGELEAGQAAATRELARLSSELRTLERRLASLDTETAAAAEQAERAQAAAAETRAAIAALRASVDELARREIPVVPAAPSSPPPPPPAPKPEAAARDAAVERIYAAALASFQAQEHGQAVLEFMDLLAKFPRHALAPSAQLWIGEAYYRQHDFRQALVEFQKVVDLHPKSAPVPDALLRIGLCLRALRDPGRAAQHWGRLVREYPGSDAAAQARSLLAGSGSATTETR